MKRLGPWYPAIGLAIAAVVCLYIYGTDGNWTSGIIAVIALLTAAWFVSPALGGSGRCWNTIRDSDDDSPVVVFWRPGCIYCLRLRTALGAAGNKAEWVNIWQDDDGRAFVRQHNDGNETVPTVILADGVVTNPPPARVRRELSKL